MTPEHLQAICLEVDPAPFIAAPVRGNTFYGVVALGKRKWSLFLNENGSVYGYALLVQEPGQKRRAVFIESDPLALLSRLKEMSK